MKIIIGSDHGGFLLKEKVKSFLNKNGYEVIDEGTYNTDSVDYPDYAKKVCKKVLAENAIGILMCGTGIGISISANKIKGIRCALCSDEYSAKMAKEHNNANVLALGARVIGEELAYSIIETFLKNKFVYGRHEKRVKKIEEE